MKRDNNHFNTFIYKYLWATKDGVYKKTDIFEVIYSEESLNNHLY
jgi:hypothetical protein